MLMRLYQLCFLKWKKVFYIEYYFNTGLCLIVKNDKVRFQWIFVRIVKSISDEKI